MQAIDEARKLLGLRHQLGARDFRRGRGATDCVGLVVEFLRRLDLEMPDPATAKLAVDWRGGTLDAFDAFVPDHWRAVDQDAPRRAGDLLIMDKGRHVAVAVSPHLALTSEKRQGSCLLPMAGLRVHRVYRRESDQ